MTPTTYGRDFAYCLKSHGGVRGFNASLWRFLLRCTLFCHSVATFLTSVSSYEGGCGFEEIHNNDKETWGKLLYSPPHAKYIRPVFVFTKFYMESNTFVKMYFYKPFKSTKFIIS